MEAIVRLVGWSEEEEWIQLMKRARDQGLQLEQVREMLQQITATKKVDAPIEVNQGYPLGEELSKSTVFL